MRLTIEDAARRADNNKESFGGEWRVQVQEEKLYVQMIGETEEPADSWLAYTTTDGFTSESELNEGEDND